MTMNAVNPKIYVVDDDEAIRDSLRWLFESRGYRVETYDSGEAFLAGYKVDSPGCVLLDVRMGGISGIQLYDKLRTRNFSLPVLFLTGHGDVPMAVEAMKGGAVDFIEKPFNDNKLVDRVEAYVKRNAREREARVQRETVTARLAALTAREREVMEHVLAGKLNKVIADELDISMRTVEVHRSRVMEKMGVRSAVELAQLLSAAEPKK